MKNVFLKYLCIFVILVSSINLGAQDNNKRARVKLKSGHELVGELIKYDMDKQVILRISENGNITIPMTEIKSLKMEGENISEPYRFRTNRIYNRTSVSILRGESGKGFSLNHTVSYLFSEWFSVGLGVGIDNYYNEDGYNIFPVFGEFKSYFTKNNAAPFASLRLGYGFNKNDLDIGQVEANGGYLINPTIGYRLSDGKMMVEIFTGIKIQNADYVTRNGESIIRDDITFKRLEIGLAFLF